MSSQFKDQDVLARFKAPWPARVDCKEGWWPIISRLNQELSYLDSEYTIAQVKEKLGELRFYLDKFDPEQWPVATMLIGWAEALARQTCEICGEAGTPRLENTGPTYWQTRTRCWAHRRVY